MKITKVDTTLEAKMAGIVRSMAIWRCQQCGGCTAVCPSAKHGGVNVGEILARASIGALDVKNDRTLWLCAACMGCSERCPSEVDPAEVITVLKNLAADSGNVPPYLLDEAKRFIQTGFCFPRTGLTRKMRKDLDLKELEIATGAVNDLREIVKRTRLGRLDLDK